MECSRVIMVTSCAWGSDINKSNVTYAFTASAIICQLPLLDLSTVTVLLFACIICLYS